ILASLSAVLSPLLLAALLTRFVPNSDLEVNYLSIVQTLLATQIVPLAMGLMVHERAPVLSSRMAGPLSFVANLLLLAVVVLLRAEKYQTVAAIRVGGWIGMLLLRAPSLAIGGACGSRGRAPRTTLALTPAARTAAVGLVIVAPSFAGTAAGTAFVAYGLV